MENSEFVNLPGRRVKPGQQFRQEEDGDMIQTSTVKMFSMESLGEHVFLRKKKIAREFGEGGNGEGRSKNDFLNQLAVLEGGESEVAVESNSQEMEDWLRKLHVRTNRVIEKATPAATSRLDAISHAAKTAARLKGNALTSTSGKLHSRRQSHRPADTPETVTKLVATVENNGEDNLTKPLAARSRGTTKQTAEHREKKTRKKTSRDSGKETTSETSSTSIIDPSVSES